MTVENEHPARVVIISYAFKSLDPQQAQAVAAHIATCPQCRSLVALYQARSEQAQAAEQPAASADQPPARLASSALPTRPLARIQKTPWMRLNWLHVALALAAFVLLVANVLQLIQARSMRDEQNDLLRTIQANQVINALASESGIELAPVSGPKGQGTLLYEKSGTSGILFLRNLPPLDSSHTYQAWFVPASGAPINAGAFHPNAGTPFASVLINADRPITSFLEINVTVEPVAGSQVPSGNPILTIRF